MKKFSKFIALCLGLLLLASCSASPELLSFLPETEDVFEGFDGKEFVIVGNWPRSWDPNTDEENEGALSLAQDSLIAHNNKIMKDYDCKIRTVLTEWDFANNFIADVLSNNVDYDLMDTNLNFMINNIIAKFVNPWEYAGIDTSNTDKYGPSGYLEAAEYNGLHYGIWPNYWTQGIEYRGVMGVNNNLLGKFTDVSVYELYENGRWTFDEFKNILRLCKADESIYPFSYYDESMYVICNILANGSNLVVYDEDVGRYIYGMRDPKAIKALEFASSLAEEELIVAEKDYYDYFKIKQTAVFTITETWCIGGDIDGMDMICYPFGPDAEYGKDFASYRSTNNRYVFMPITVDTTEVGRFVDIWFEELEDYPKSSAVETFKSNNFFNDNSADMWMTLAEEAKYPYGFELAEGGVYENFCDALARSVIGGSQALSSVTDSYRDRVTDLINKYLNN